MGGDLDPTYLEAPGMPAAPGPTYHVAALLDGETVSEGETTADGIELCARTLLTDNGMPASSAWHLARDVTTGAPPERRRECQRGHWAVVVTLPEPEHPADIAYDDPQVLVVADALAAVRIRSTLSKVHAVAIVHALRDAGMLAR